MEPVTVLVKAYVVPWCKNLFLYTMVVSQTCRDVISQQHDFGLRFRWRCWASRRSPLNHRPRNSLSGHAVTWPAIVSQTIVTINVCFSAVFHRHSLLILAFVYCSPFSKLVDCPEMQTTTFVAILAMPLTSCDFTSRYSSITVSNRPMCVLFI